MDRRRPFGARWERAREALETTILPAVTLRDRFFIGDSILSDPWTRGKPACTQAAECAFGTCAGGKAVDGLADLMPREGDPSYHVACDHQPCTAMLQRVCGLDGVERWNDPGGEPAPLWYKGASSFYGGDFSAMAVLWTGILFFPGVVHGASRRKLSKK